MSAPFYMNVWSDKRGHQWSDDVPIGELRQFQTRDFCDRVAHKIHARPQVGIRRVAVLRVTLKQGCAA